MSLVGISGRIFLPSYFSRLAGTHGFGSQIIDAAGEEHAVIFRVPKTGNLSHLLFRVGSVTSAQTLRVGLETVDATTGFPTGTAYGSMVVGTQASPSANTLYEVALGTAASATDGDVVAMVVEFDSTVGNLQLSMFSGIRDMNQGLPYAALYTGTWAKQSDLNMTPIIGVKYDDGSYHFVGGMVGQTASSATFNNTSTPDERGNVFTLDAPVRVCGLWGAISPTANCDLVLYNSSDTVLATVSIDADQVAGTTMRLVHGFFDPVSLAIGTYRVVVKPTTASDVNISYISVNSNGQFGCNAAGEKVVLTTRTDAGAWTNTSTEQVSHLGMIIDQIDDGTGSGGSGGARQFQVGGQTVL